MLGKRLHLEIVLNIDRHSIDDRHHHLVRGLIGFEM